MDECVHIFPAPITASAGTAGAESVPTRGVGKIQVIAGSVLLGVGVEIIIKVNAIDVVAADDIHDDSQGVVLDAFLTRIKPELTSVPTNQFRMGAADVIRGDSGPGAQVTRAKRIKPGVQFQAAFMGFFDSERERVIERLRWL